MWYSEIVRINEDGTLKIPLNMRDGLGFVEGMHVMLRAESTKREIRIVPFTAAEVDLVEFRIKLIDKPGSLAKTATFLSEKNINLLASESSVLQAGELSSWIVVADISNCKDNIRDLCKKMKEEGLVEEAICRSFH